MSNSDEQPGTVNAVGDVIDFGRHHHPVDPTAHIRDELERNGRLREPVTGISVPIDVWQRCAREAGAGLGHTVIARDAGAYVTAELQP